MNDVNRLVKISSKEGKAIGKGKRSTVARSWVADEQMEHRGVLGRRNYSARCHNREHLSLHLPGPVEYTA